MVTIQDYFGSGGAGISQIKVMLKAVVDSLNSIDGRITFLQGQYNTLKTLTNELKASLSEHTHSDLLISHSGVVKGSSANEDSENIDADAEPTNGHVVAAYATVATGAWTHGALTNPDISRNVAIVIENDSGGSLNLYEGDMTFTITGACRGLPQEEIITFTSIADNKAIATSKFRYKYGVKPFDVITNIVLDNVPNDGLKIAAGLGSKIALPCKLASPAEADVTKVTKNSVDLPINGLLVDETNMTVNLGVLTDGDNFNIVFKPDAGKSSQIIADDGVESTEISTIYIEY